MHDGNFPVILTTVFITLAWFKTQPVLGQPKNWDSGFGLKIVVQHRITSERNHIISLIIKNIKTPKITVRCCSIRDEKIRILSKTIKNKQINTRPRGSSEYIRQFLYFGEKIKCHLSPFCTSLQFCSGARLYVRNFLCYFSSVRRSFETGRRVISHVGKGLIISE